MCALTCMVYAHTHSVHTHMWHMLICNYKHSDICVLWVYMCVHVVLGSHRVIKVWSAYVRIRGTRGPGHTCLPLMKKGRELGIPHIALAGAAKSGSHLGRQAPSHLEDSCIMPALHMWARCAIPVRTNPHKPSGAWAALRKRPHGCLLFPWGSELLGESGSTLGGSMVRNMFWHAGSHL